MQFVSFVAKLLSMNVTHLECALCGLRHEAGVLQNLCVECGKPLLVRYDLEKAGQTLTKDSLNTRESSLWRYRELLPLPANAEPVTLGEGMTPLLPCTRLGKDLGLPHLVDCGLAQEFRPRRGDRAPFPSAAASAAAASVIAAAPAAAAASATTTAAGAQPHREGGVQPVHGGSRQDVDGHGHRSGFDRLLGHLSVVGAERHVRATRRAVDDLDRPERRGASAGDGHRDVPDR